MIDDISDIQEWYDAAAQSEDTRLDQNQLEHDITWRYLEQFLPEDGSILEIGAATGRYTLGLAQRGYQVTAVELSENLLEQCRRCISDADLKDRVRFIKGDARDLSALGNQLFDAVLLMGPLYHLSVEQDRLLAITQAYDHLKPDGFLLSALMSRFGILGDVMKGIPGWIEEQDVVRSLICEGQRPKNQPKGGFRGYFATISEIAPLHEKAGLITQVLAAAEPVISADDASYNALTGDHRKAWLDLLFRISTEESCLGASRHLLYVGRKPMQ